MLSSTAKGSSISRSTSVTGITQTPDGYLKRMPCHDAEKFQTIGLECKEGQLLLLGKDNGNEPWTRVPVLDAKAQGPEALIILSRRFFIKALDFGLNTISIIDQIAPLRFHNKGRQMIVMPLRPDGANTQPSAVIVPRCVPPDEDLWAIR